jgi:lysozyme family protein
MTTNDYVSLYVSAEVFKRDEVEARAALIIDEKVTYARVETVTGIPWWCVGTIHSLEAGLNFSRHLHNGDPLLRRTVHVPKGRPVAPPKSGHLPYTWEESAIDALSSIWQPPWWSVAKCLEFFERYNGRGYQPRGVNSPYLWSFTQHYTRGLFVGDGRFDPEAVSSNIGAAALLKVLEEKGEVNLTFSR